MKLNTLKALLDISNRQRLYNCILDDLNAVGDLKFTTFETYEISGGIIPIIKIAPNSKSQGIKHVKVFVGAQHNEYNGLFSILEFFKLLQQEKITFKDVLKEDQILYFLPLMNPYGFLNPNKDNKSGYYLKSGTNLNRFWRRAFAPEYKSGNEDLDISPIPEQIKIIKNLLQKYWDNKEIFIYILDFHETSLLERFLIDLSKNLTPFYKFDHFLKEGIVLNIIKLYNMTYYREPLFFKCNPSADHTHINLTYKQIETFHEKLQDYISKNQEKGKLPFYFCYSNKSKDYCLKLAKLVYIKLEEKLWETHFPAFDHSFHNHGCFVRMSDATTRPRVYSMELESQKHFFNIFEEIKKSKSDPHYIENKINLINVSIELALKTIKEMILLF